MLKFLVFDDGRPATDFNLRNAHLVGSDDVGVKSRISFSDGVISAERSSVGSCGLALQVEVEGAGDLTLQTCLLPDREEPYLLMLELLRHRLMRMIAKQEDWALFELDEEHPAARRIQLARHKFIDALDQTDDPPTADRLAREALAVAIDASEELALHHAGLLLERRLQSGHFTHHTFGCGVSLTDSRDRLSGTLATNFDYIHLPAPWRQLEPVEQEFDFKPLDGWCEWAYRHHLPIVVGPIVSFSPDNVPDWMYIWEHDYDTVRDLLYEHIERVVTRYRSVVSVWTVVSGLHVNKHFSFNYDQLMDLTRMAVMLCRKIHPNARTVIELTQPFGEYYAFSQQSIPPVIYAEMLMQQGIPFDAIGLKILMGKPADGESTRDLLQLSSLLDQYSGLSKPVHVSGVAVPSEPVDGETSANGFPVTAGYWRRPWSGTVQSKWLEAFYNVTLSKPFVESVAWLNLTDSPDAELPGGGLISGDFKPKKAYRRLISIRKTFEENIPGFSEMPAEPAAD